MIPLCALLLATQVPIEQPSRLRTMLPNGAIVLVERVPNAKSLTVDLFVSSRGTVETPATHGRRHLLEHLVALGTRGDLDRKLETIGGFLNPKTYRDSMLFEMSLPATGLKAGLSAVTEIVTGSNFDTDATKREANILAEEGALRDGGTLASAEAWKEAFGDFGLDPFGSLDIIRDTKPDDLRALRGRMFAAGNIAVVVSGNVDLDQTTKAVRDAISFLPAAKLDKETLRREALKPVVTVHQDGEYRGVAVPGYRSPLTAAAMAAACAISSQVDGCELLYTPSGRPGLVLLGAPHGTLNIDELRAADLFALGKQMAARWVRLKLSDPQSAASFRGMLLVQERDLKPEIMLENLESLPFEDYDRAFKQFQSGVAPK